MEDEDFLDAINDGEDTAAPEAQPAPEPETVKDEAPETKPRDEHGRFLPKADDTPPPPEPAPEPAPPPPAPEPQHAPIAALLDERDRRKAAEDRLKQLEAAQPPAQPAQVPDMFESPEEYNEFLSRQLDNRMYVERRHMSERLARIEHGAEILAKAKEWGVAKCDTDPYFNAKVLQSQDPYGVVIDEWKREQASAIPSDELEQFRAWKAANSALPGQPPALPGTAPPAPAAIPPRSLASAPSAGGVLTEPEQTDEDIFAEVMPKG